MKKRVTIFTLLLLFAVAGVFQSRAFATGHTLQEVANAFNNCKTVADYADYGYRINASIDEQDENILNVTLLDEESGTTIMKAFTLDGSVLSANELTTEHLSFMMILADSVGQINGYEDGELFDTLNSDQIKDYTLEKEGIEIKEDGEYYTIRMDIDKVVPLADFSNFYLKPDQFEFVAGLPSEGESGNQMGKEAKLAYSITVTQEESSIVIGEKGDLTMSAYNSVCSAIEALYNKDAVDYFQSICPEVSECEYDYDGMSIVLFADVSEDSFFDGMKAIKVVLDNGYMKDRFLRTEYIGEKVERGEKTLNIDFSANNSYKIDLFSSISESGDIGFLYKYILEPVFLANGAGYELTGDTVYFKIEDGKIVVGDKDNSLFKLVIGETNFELLPTDPDAAKTSVTAKHENVSVAEYQEGVSGVHTRYGNYQVTVNMTFGKEEAAKKDDQKETNPADPDKKNDSGKTVSANSSAKTGDMGTAVKVLLYGIVIVVSTAALVKTKKESKC